MLQSLYNGLTAALRFWEAGDGFLHVLEDHEANWSGLLKLFLVDLMPQERMGNMTAYWKGGSGMLQ